MNATRDPELSAPAGLAGAAPAGHEPGGGRAAGRAPGTSRRCGRSRTGTTVSSAVFDPVDCEQGRQRRQVTASHRSGTSRPDAAWRACRPKSGFKVTGTADAVAFNPAGTEVAVGYGDGAVALFDARSGRELRSISVGLDGQRRRVRRQHRRAGDRDAERRRRVAAQDGSSCCHMLSHAQANTIAVDPRNPLEFAVATANGTVIWNIAAGKPGSCSSPQAWVRQYDAAFSPDGSEVVTADSDGICAGLQPRHLQDGDDPRRGRSERQERRVQPGREADRGRVLRAGRRASGTPPPGSS